MISNSNNIQKCCFCDPFGIVVIELNENRGTKDKAVIFAKLQTLTALMCEYFGINEEFLNKDNILAFVQENVDPEIDSEDMELYTEILEDLIDTPHKAVVIKNKPSVISIVAFACVNDIDLDEWLTDYISKAKFTGDQKVNYLRMVDELENFRE